MAHMVCGGVEQASLKKGGGLSVSGKGLYIDDQNCPHLVNLNEDPLMTECLVYFLAPGHTLVGSDVSEVPPLPLRPMPHAPSASPYLNLPLPLRPMPHAPCPKGGG